MVGRSGKWARAAGLTFIRDAFPMREDGRISPDAQPLYNECSLANEPAGVNRQPRRSGPDGFNRPARFRVALCLLEPHRRTTPSGVVP